jgi:hypothetical protein
MIPKYLLLMIDSSSGGGEYGSTVVYCGISFFAIVVCALSLCRVGSVVQYYCNCSRLLFCCTYSTTYCVE